MRKFQFTLLITILLTSCISKDQEKNNTTPPNIIWLMAEDISTDLECYGTKGVQTPNFNKLAEQGVKFENCFVTNPICSPSRSAMLVGTHQLITNTHNHRSNRNVPLDTLYKPFTHLLKQAGYTTILGHHGVLEKGRKIDVNFKHKAIGDWDGVENFGLFNKLDTFKVEDQPFFAQIQLKATHRGDWWDEVRENSNDPVNPDSVELPPYMADHPVVRLDWAKYLDQMEFIDNELGMIQAELEEKGMTDNTIIIFIGDNGRCNIRGKGYLHDPGLRVPLIIFDPRAEGGKVYNGLVSSIDITATIMNYAGLEVPEYMTGSPIFDKDFKREFVFSTRDLWDEIHENSRSITNSKWKYIRNHKPNMPFDVHQAYLEFYRPAVHVMRTLKNEGKLNELQGMFFAEGKPFEELYDLENDPFETNNLAGNLEYQPVLQKMQAELNTLQESHTPANNIFETNRPTSVDILEWVKKEKPEEYKRMQEGVEIGYRKYSREYKTWLREKKK